MSRRKHVRSPQSSAETRFTRATEQKKGSAYVLFSFKYLNLDHHKFNINGRDHSYLRSLLDRLRDVSGLTLAEFRQSSGKTLRVHRILWDDVTETGFGIPNEEELVGEDAYQFALSANEHGRIHGFIINETFYAVWLDPEHKLYS